MSILLGDGAEFEIEREFYCEHCKDFRDTFENQNDLVCFECKSVIATYRDSKCFARKPYIAGFRAAQAVVLDAVSLSRPLRSDGRKK